MNGRDNVRMNGFPARTAIIRFRNLFRAGSALSVVCGFMLSGCDLQSPPAGYQPAAVRSPNACPDVSGPWKPTDLSWFEEFMTLKTSGLTGERIALITGSDASALRTLHLRSDRQTFLAAARQLALTAPLAHAEWRSALLEAGLGGPASGRARDPDALHAAIARLGPVYETRTTLTLRQCSEGWALLGYRDVQAADESGKQAKPREVELWISRSARNELLLRRTTYDVLHYSLWASSTQTLRTSSRSEYSKWPGAEAVDPSPIKVEDLAPLQVTVGKDCRFTPEQIRRLLLNAGKALPSGVVLKEGGPGATPGRWLGPEGCSAAPFSMVLTVQDTALLPAIREALRKLDGITFVEPVRPMQPVQPGSNLYLARMMARAPAE